MNQNDDWNDKHDDDSAQKTDANVDDDPALLPSVGSKRARRAPPKSSTPIEYSLLTELPTSVLLPWSVVIIKIFGFFLVQVFSEMSIATA